MSGRRYARGEGGTLRVTFDDGRGEQSFTFAALVRAKRMLAALREREVARLDGEIAETDELLEQAQALGCTGGGPTGARLAAVEAVKAQGVTLPGPTLWKRLWGMLTKPRGIGQ